MATTKRKVIIGTLIYLGARQLIRWRRRMKTPPGIVVITGGTRGLGRALVLGYLERGWRVATCARRPDELDSLTAGYGSDRLMAVEADNTDPASMAAFVSTIMRQWGKVDVWINNAAELVYGPAEELEPEDYDHMLTTNFYSVITGVKAALPLVRPQGQIITIMSSVALMPIPRLAAYGAAKAAAAKYLEAVEIEHGRTHRFLNAYLGYMPTSLQDHATYRGQPDVEKRNYERRLRSPILSISPQRAAALIINAQLEGRHTLMAPESVMVGAWAARLAPRLARRCASYAERRYYEHPGASAETPSS